MFNFLRRYWKYFIFIFVVILMLTISFITDREDTIQTESDKKMSVINKKESKNKDNGTVFVDIKGAVNSPGVYEIEEGKRITDVIKLAGGLTNDSYTKNLNLSKKVEDEMYLIIYTTKEIEDYMKNNNSSDNKALKCVSTECVCPDTGNKACNNAKDAYTTKASKESKNEEKKTNLIQGKISINTASLEELMTLKGIGEAKAKKIIDYRNTNGYFEKIEDILNVSGIGESIFNKIKDNIEV